jgi:hypothetical protein
MTRVVPVTAQPPRLVTVPPAPTLTTPDPVTSALAVMVCVPKVNRSSPEPDAPRVPALVPALRASRMPDDGSTVPPARTERPGTRTVSVPAVRMSEPDTSSEDWVPPWS